MTADELLNYLRGQGVVLWAEGGRLRFRAPEGVVTPALRESMVSLKEELLDRLRREVSQSNNKRFPLSYAQRGLWLIAQTVEGPLFNQPLAFRIHGPLDGLALTKSLKEIVRRHEILRMGFKEEGGEPYQVVESHCHMEVPIESLKDLSPEKWEDAAIRLATEEAIRPFTIARAPLLRAKLFCLDDKNFVFILTTHTLVADGYSMGIFLWELSELYKAFSKDKPSPLPKLPLQFTDYVLTQQQSLKGGELDSQLAYWRKQLFNPPSRIQWPTSPSGSEVTAHRGRTETFILDPELSESIRDVSRTEGVTLFALLMASLNTYLYQLTGQEDLIVATTISHRNQQDVEGLIGYFANTLLLRTRIDHKLTFRDLMRQCHETIADALAHQDLPFERLLEVWAPDSEFQPLPPVQVMFVLHDHSIEEDLKLPGLDIKQIPIDRGMASFDLYLRMENTTGPIKGSWEIAGELPSPKKIFSRTKIPSPKKIFPRAKIPKPDKMISRGTEPETDRERRIADLWKEILQLDNINVEDNFFDLGGRSVHIIQAHGRLQKSLKQDFPLVEMFRYPTVRSQALYLAQQRDRKSVPDRSRRRTDLLQASRERRRRARPKP
jgi:hypothetical protein